MDAPVLPSAGETLVPGVVVKTAHAPAQHPREALATLVREMGDEDLSLVVLFVSPSGDLPAIAAEAAAVFGATPVIGCSTAGEISPRGYTEGEIVAVGFPKSHFVALIQFVADLKAMLRKDVVRSTVKLRGELARVAPQWTSEFAFLMVDGLSLLEDQLVSALSTALGPTPLFGGSAGDGLDFKQTFVIHEGRVHRDAAVLALIRTDCAIKVFNFDHLTPTERKMVVTEADPERRVVREINGEPAAREYARLLGMDPEQLSPFIFAAHPVVVKVGGKHHVRAIQKVEPNGDLTFFSAIDEGLVLTLADPRDIARDLDAALGDLALRSRPQAIIACDCILRRVEAEQKQAIRALSGILSANKVVGFSTYGEQLNSVHVNQTMTGIAIYAPPGGKKAP
ncbi:FIST N-terminal domain-containing protein [Pelagibius sp.]|uniref:FIST N-terminal domain-containing protein n=1 Tax=Pelagibius sp. TaxID=1931238 RepID=UPI0026322AD2|nr:FIST N-terminal domain-containing protein [Pelagibius sp.]